MGQQYRVSLLSLIDLDLETKLLRVIVLETVKGFWGDKTIEHESTFTYCAGIWLGPDNRAVLESELTFSLQEILVADIANKRLDKFVA